VDAVANAQMRRNRRPSMGEYRAVMTRRDRERITGEADVPDERDEL